MRDLLRKRSFLVKQRTMLILSLKSLVERQTSLRLSRSEVKTLEPSDLELLLADEHLILSAQANLSTISFLTHRITQIEKAAKKKVKLREAFKSLKTVPGIGDILALTIMLEVGDISRFPKVGDFVSYARCAPTERLSDGKSKGHGNAKNGNRHHCSSRRHCSPKRQRVALCHHQRGATF